MITKFINHLFSNFYKLKNNLFREALVYSLSNFAVAGVPFLLLPVLTRYLDPSSFGLISMFTLVVGFMSIGVGFNVRGSIIIRYFDRSSFDIKTYVSSVFALVMISLIPMFLLVLIGGTLISLLTNIPIPWLYIAILVSYFQVLVHILLVLWQASGKALKYGLLRFFHAFLDSSLSLIFVVCLSFTWMGRLSGLLIAWLIAALIALHFLRRDKWITQSFDRLCTKDALRYGIPLIPHTFGGLILGMSDRFVVNNIMDISSTGLYAVAVQFGLVLAILADSFNKAYSPWLMKKLTTLTTQLKYKIVRYTYYYFFLLTILAILLSNLFVFLMPVIISEKYHSIDSILIYIFIGNAFMGMYYMVTNYIFFKRRTEVLSILTIIIGLITFALNFYFVDNYGIKGAALSFMIGQFLLFICAWILSNICVPMPWLKISLFRNYLSFNR